MTASTDGRENLWTRLLAVKLGAPVLFANAGNAGGGAEALAVLNRLRGDYGTSTSRQVDQIFAIVGNPICGTLSPRLHNSAYRAHRLSALFVYLPVSSFSEFWTKIVQANAFDQLGLPLAGFTVAAPHKRAGVGAAADATPLCRRAHSCNLMTRRSGRWIADTTDASGLLDCLQAVGFRPRRKRIAVIGCGGSGRAIAAALDDAGADVVLVNRGKERGLRAARLLQLPWVPLAEFSPAGCAAIINATPVGRANDNLPLDFSLIAARAIVIDLVYVNGVTPLVTTARAAGIETIDGEQVLLAQVARQYHAMTGEEMPATTLVRPRRASLRAPHQRLLTCTTPGKTS